MNGGIKRLAFGMVFITFATAAAQQSAPASRPAMRTNFGQPSVTVPMEFFGNRPVMSVSINGQGPFRFIVDTGTPFTAVIDGNLLRRLDLPVPALLPPLNQITADNPLRIARIGVGDAEIADAEIIPADFGGFLAGGADVPKGILGLPLFAQGLLTLDYPQGKYVFEPGVLDAQDKNVIACSPRRGGDFGLSIVATVADKLIKIHIDTGSPAGITLLNKWEKELPLSGDVRSIGSVTTPGGSAEVRRGVLNGNVTFAGQEFVRPVIEFADLGPMLRYDCGNIGSSLLRDYAMTIDQKNSLLRFVRGVKPANVRAGALDETAARYRIGARMRNENFTLIVELVEPGSPADIAGMQLNDVITAIGDMDLRGWGNELKTVFDTPNPVKLAVRRGNEKLTLIVTPEPVKPAPVPAKPAP
jgi:hypothetical protein